MSRIRDEQLAELSSMKQLKRAQGKVAGEIKRIERRRKRKYREAVNSYSSWRNVFGDTLSIIDGFQCISRYVRYGYNAVRNHMSCD